MLHYLSKQDDLRASVRSINDCETKEALSQLLQNEAPVAAGASSRTGASGRERPKERMLNSARLYRENFEAAKTCLSELRSILIDETYGVIPEIRRRFKKASEERLEPVFRVLSELAENPTYTKSANDAMDDLRKHQHGGIYYLSDAQVREAIEVVLNQLASGIEGEVVSDFLPDKLLSTLVDNEMIVRSFLDVVMAKNNRKYGEGIQNVVRMVASMNGCPDKSLNDLGMLGAPLSTDRQFKARVGKQLTIERICAVLWVLAGGEDGDDPLVIVSALDNYFRTYARKTAGSVLHGSWGTMNLTNHIMRLLKHFPENARARISKLISSDVGMYEGIWSEENKSKLAGMLREVCSTAARDGNPKSVYGGGFSFAVDQHATISQELKAFLQRMLDTEACQQSRKALEPAFSRGMMHGTIDMGESIEGLMERIYHAGLINIDSNSRAGCLEMLRLLTTHPACHYYLTKDRLFICAGDIALVYHWLNGVMSGAYPMEFLKRIVFIPDMWLHPLIKLNKLIWQNFGWIISSLFTAVTPGLGKFQEGVRLSTSRVWLGLIHEAFTKSKEAQKILIDLKLKFDEDPSVVALDMFFGQHLPLVVALSNCMEQAKRPELRVREQAFDSLYHILLPAMAHSFHVLRSHTYR